MNRLQLNARLRRSDFLPSSKGCLASNLRRPASTRATDESKPASAPFDLDPSFTRDRENVVRGLFLVAREAWRLSEIPAPLSNAVKVVSEHATKAVNEASVKLHEAKERGASHFEQHNIDNRYQSVPSENKESIWNKEATGRAESSFKVVDDKIPTRVLERAAKNGVTEAKKIEEEEQRRLHEYDKVEPLHYKIAPEQRKVFHEASVPSTPVSRALGFGGLFTGLALGTIAEATRRATGLSSASGVSAWVSDANAERLAATLCRMRGAALKLGQMLSIQDEHMLPGPLGAALDRVRAGADRMPDSQLNAVLAKEFNCVDWRERYFQSFDTVPLAAASLGQVHFGELKNGQKVAIKVQYPGVAESIESDVANLRRLVRLTGIFPKGLFIDRILDVVGSELKEECDYAREAKHQREFGRLLKDDRAFKVPFVVDELSTERVLTMEYVEGVPLDKVADLPQAVRDRVGRSLLRLTLRELFEFGYVQSDPNFANYYYDPNTGKLNLLDFGASKRYDDTFVDAYAELVWAAAEGDRDTLLNKSIEIGLLTGRESDAMMDAHCESAFDIAEPFSRRLGNLSYDFARSDVAAKIAKHGPVFMRDRLTPPPQEIYSLHRKLSGAFMACVRIKSRFPCRDLLEHSIKQRRKDAEKHKAAAAAASPSSPSSTLVV